MTLAREDVIAVLGPVDEALIAEIIKTGATAEDVAEAWTWLNSDEALIGEGRALPSGTVARVIELLAPAEDDPPG